MRGYIPVVPDDQITLTEFINELNGRITGNRNIDTTTAAIVMGIIEDVRKKLTDSIPAVEVMP